MKWLGLALAATLGATGCASSEELYFGRTDPPDEQRLVFLNGGEPDSLDPGMHPGGREMPIIEALFDGLTKMHPVTLEPLAGLATHYESNPDRTRFTFYLRGHASPRGIRLPNTDTLREEYRAGRLSEDLSRGRAAPSDALPARWSDGVVITAHDFVYAWRRVVDPQAASPNAASLFDIRNAEEINRGRQPVTALGVRALDDFTLQVDLRAPVPFFLQLQSQRMFRAVPRHVIEQAAARGRETSWTEPEHIVTSGPFMLGEWRPYDQLVVRRNPRYYESALVGLDEIVFLPVGGTTGLNLYKAGIAHAGTGGFFPSEIGVRHFAGKRDFRVSPVLFRLDFVINTRRPPFDNVLVRYALSMATDRVAMARLLQRGDVPSAGYILAMAGYEPIRSLPVTVRGATYDVLAHDPKGARELLAAAGLPDGIGPDGRRLTITIAVPATLFAEVLQEQWRSALGVEVRVQPQEFKVWLQSLIDVTYEGVAAGGWTAKYYDPNTFIDFFVTGSAQSGTGWSDPAFDAMLADANATVDSTERLRKLADCERYLLKAMPMIGLFHASWPYLQKSYVRGMPHNPLDERRFEYAWIDTRWDQSESRVSSAR